MRESAGRCKTAARLKFEFSSGDSADLSLACSRLRPDDGGMKGSQR